LKENNLLFHETEEFIKIYLNAKKMCEEPWYIDRGNASFDSYRLKTLLKGFDSMKQLINDAKINE
jgi:hypothetical protein